MRTCCILILFMLFGKALAQNSWQAVEPFQVRAYDIIRNGNADLLLLSQHALYKRSPSEPQWSNIGSINSGTLFLANDNSILFGGWYGIRRSTDHGSTFLSTNLDSGRIATFAQMSNGILLAGSKTHGIYRSLDTGKSWSVVHALNVNILYSLGSLCFAGTGSGIRVTSENGSIWISSNLDTTAINAFATNGRWLFAGGKDFYRSSDSGVTWQLLSSALPEVLSIAAVDSNTIVIGTRDGGVWRSSDGGISWSDTGLDVQKSHKNWFENPKTFFFIKRIGSALYASNRIRLFRSFDGGVTWNFHDNGLTEEIVVKRISPQSDSLRAFLASITEIYSTTNNGKSWIVRHVDGLPWFTDIIIIDSGYIMAAELFGSYVSKDSGQTWLVSAYGKNYFRGTSWITRLPDNSLFLADQGSGALYKSTQNGYSSTRVPCPVGWVYSLTGTKDTMLYIGVGNKGIYSSSDHGTNWTYLGPDSTAMTSFVKESASLFFAGSTDKGVYRSTNAGASWSQVNNGLTNLQINALLNPNPGLLFAATNGAGVFRSIDSGNTWTAFNNGLSNLNVNALVLDANGRMLAGTNWGLYSTIEIVPVELTSFTASLHSASVILHWRTQSESNNYGFDIERSTQGAWETIGFVEGSGTTTRPQEYSFIDASLPQDFSGIVRYRLRQRDYDGSMEYSQEVSLAIGSRKGFDFELYPNPVSVSLGTVALRLSSSLHDSRVKVIDVLGRTVRVHSVSASESFVNLSLAGMAPGVYRIAVETPDGVRAKQLVLLR